MTFFRKAGRIVLSILLSIGLAFGLSACATPRVTLFAPSCFSQMVEASGLDKPTPHAPLPDNKAGSWVDYGNRESGQLDVANTEKGAVIGIGKTCDRWAAEAKQKVERKPLLRRIFG